MPSDSLDIEQPAALRAYLVDGGYLNGDEPARLTVLQGGVSNRTVLVERPGGDDWVIKQSLEKLRTAADWFSRPERIHREAAGMRWLAQLAPPGQIVPLVFEDRTRHVLAMRAVPQPHANWKTMLLRGEIDADHFRQFGALLAAIEQNAYARRDRVQPAFADRSFFESLRVEPYYGYTASRVPQARAAIEALIADTRANLHTLTHGDYSPKNVLVHAQRLVLLDHEVIHWGDPGFDLGFSLTHFLSKALHLPAHRDALRRAAHIYWETYWSSLPDVPWRAGLEARAVRHTLGCLLARVEGRSPLEYLTAAERVLQRQLVLGLLAKPPPSISILIDEFTAQCERVCE